MAFLINTAGVHDYDNLTPTSMSLPPTSLTAGNFIVVAFSTFRFFATAPTGAVTDTAGNTYTQAIRQIDTANGWQSIQIYYCANALGHDSNVVTVTYGGGPSGQHSILSAQYHGVAHGGEVDSTLDATSSNSSGFTASTTQTTAQFTTTNANDLIIAVFHNNSHSTWTRGAGYRIRVSEDTLALQDRSVSSLQIGATSSITSSDSGNWITAVAAFKGDGSAPPTRNYCF